MFTGLVETVGRIAARSSLGRAGKLEIRAEGLPLGDVRKGDSIAVNGVCLTAERIDVRAGILEFHTLSETLARSNLGAVPVGHEVNLERALRLGDRLGGHLVSGHIDCTAPILDIRRSEDDWVVTVGLAREYAALVVEKGSVAVDGISLTVAELGRDRFGVHLIPHSWEATALHAAKAGDLANLEFDLVGKYILRREDVAAAKDGGLTLDDLSRAGFAG